MTAWLDDDDGDGATPWALGDDDVGPLDRWDGTALDDTADDWLDDALSRLGPAGPTVDGECEEDRSGGVVLRKPMAARPRRRRADPDAVGDLPAVAVPGYVRDRRGTWRYAATGAAVPGARDLTLRSLHRFPVHRNQVLVPTSLVRSEAELAWCLTWKHTLTTRLAGGRSITVLRIPLREWERRADVPFGLWAPELSATRLVGIADVARVAGVSPATITAYLARRRMPEPVMRIGNTPAWTRPVIAAWLAGRPGRGVRGTERTTSC